MALLCRFNDLTNAPIGWIFYCPGCEEHHAFAVEQAQENGARWEFNGNLEQPTFTPSLLIRRSRTYRDETYCHCFVQDGRILYLGDCKHSMANQSVAMLPVDDG